MIEKTDIDDKDAGLEVLDENPNRAERIDDRETHPRDRNAGKEPGRDLRSIVKNAVKEQKEVNAKVDQPDGKLPKSGEAKIPPKGDAVKDGGKVASPAAPQNPEASKDGTVKPEAVQAPTAVAAPANAPKEVKDLWDKLPQEAQAVFAKRETDMAKGVEQLKSRYKPLEDAFAPWQDEIKRVGKNEAEIAKQMFGWHSALANPRTNAETLRALARGYNIDLSSLAPQAPRTVADQNSQQFDPQQFLKPYLEPLQNQLQGVTAEIQRRDMERVNSDIARLSKDKPHFEQVKVRMGHIMQNGWANGENEHEMFNDAYEQACRSDPQIFALIQEEQRVKSATELAAKAAEAEQAKAQKAEEARKKRQDDVDKARKAGIGPRAGSPTGMAISAASKGQSVRDTISAAMKERGATI